MENKPTDDLGMAKDMLNTVPEEVPMETAGEGEIDEGNTVLLDKSVYQSDLQAGDEVSVLMKGRISGVEDYGCSFEIQSVEVSQPKKEGGEGGPGMAVIFGGLRNR